MRRKLEVILAFMLLASFALAQTTTFTGTTKVTPAWEHTKVKGASTSKETFDPIYNVIHSTGDSTNQMDTVVVISGSLTNGQATTYNMQSLTNSFGDAVNFAKIRMLAVKAALANPDPLYIGAASSNQFASWSTTNAATTVVGPDGLWLMMRPDVDGYAVSSTTNLLKVANSGTTNVSYTVYIGGSE